MIPHKEESYMMFVPDKKAKLQILILDRFAFYMQLY